MVVRHPNADADDLARLPHLLTLSRQAMQAVNEAQQYECAILKVISVVDRLEGAAENFRAAGIKFEALFTWRDFS